MMGAMSSCTRFGIGFIEMLQRHLHKQALEYNHVRTSVRKICVPGRIGQGHFPNGYRYTKVLGAVSLLIRQKGVHSSVCVLRVKWKIKHNKRDNVRINVTLRQVGITIVAVEKQ